jgi:hypothetical protein
MENRLQELTVPRSNLPSRDRDGVVVLARFVAPRQVQALCADAWRLLEKETKCMIRKFALGVAAFSVHSTEPVWLIAESRRLHSSSPAAALP